MMNLVSGCPLCIPQLLPAESAASVSPSSGSCQLSHPALFCVPTSQLPGLFVGLLYLWTQGDLQPWSAS